MVKGKISIILPVFNAGEYLSECLDSLIGQTYNNIEILCFNDGSSDNSLDILKAYGNRDSRIRIIDQTNQGVSVIRNQGIEMADGEYLMFSDADDWWELNACEKCMQMAEKYRPDVVMFSYFREYANRSLTKDNIFPGDELYFDGIQSRKIWRSFAGLIGDELKYPENFDANNALWSKLYRTSIFKENKEVRYYNNKLIGAGGDGLLNLYYFKYVKTAVFISDHLYHYRKTNENSIVTVYKPNFLEKRSHLLNLYEEFINRNQLGDEFLTALSNRVALNIISLGLHELSAKHGSIKKINNINCILNHQRYKNALNKLDISHMPFHWKVFFYCCKHKMSMSVYLLLVCMKKMMTRV